MYFYKGLVKLFSQNAKCALKTVGFYSYCWLQHRINTSYSLYEEESAHYTQTTYLGIQRVKTFVLIRNTLRIQTIVDAGEESVIDYKYNQLGARAYNHKGSEMCGVRLNTAFERSAFSQKGTH